MQKIILSELLPYDVKKIYFLVNDINSYYHFIPYCIESNILEYHKKYIIASMKICKSGIEKTIITKNKLIHNKSISINLIKEKFLILHGYWKFIKINKYSCLIKLKIEFKIINIFLNHFFNIFIKNILKNIIISFKERAKILFNNNNIKNF